MFDAQIAGGKGYPHHPGLGSEELVQACHRITGHETILEAASIDVANGAICSIALIVDEAMVEAMA